LYRFPDLLLGVQDGEAERVDDGVGGVADNAATELQPEAVF
jgi:hypothetical protein